MELDRLNSLYTKHWLRYGSFYDLVLNAKTLPYTMTLRRIASVIRLADRELLAKP
jgi:hypothetical protein